MKSKLTTFMNRLDANKRNWTRARTGTDFEEVIIGELRKIGFNRIVREDDAIVDDYLSKIKQTIQSKTGSTLIDNTLKLQGNQYTDIFVWQPYGTQDYPDFLIFTENKIYSIETKYSKERNNKPVWNSNLPKSDGIYIFGSHGNNDITYFRGEDVLPEEERIMLNNIWEKTDRAFSEWEQQFINSYNLNEIDVKYGFYPYVRKAYEQKKTVNSEAIIDFFNNPERLTIEQKAIDFIKQTDVRVQAVPSI